MKFGSQLEENAVPEWRTRYIDYKGLKKTIRSLAMAAAEQAASTESADGVGTNISLAEAAAADASRSRAPSRKGGDGSSRLLGGERETPTDAAGLASAALVQRFADVLAVELSKVSSFYAMELGKDRYRDECLEAGCKAFGTSAASQERKKLRAKLHVGLLEFYRALTMLSSFCIFNYTACVKILKKFDKKCGLGASELLLARVKECEFVEHAAVKLLMERTKSMFAKIFTDGDLHKAASRLRVSHTLVSHTFRSADSVLPMFLCGLCFGASFILLLVLFADLVSDYPWEDEPRHTLWTITIYRAYAFVLMLAGCVAIGAFVFSENSINWFFIMDLNPRDYLKPSQYFECLSVYLLIFMGSAVLFVKSIARESHGRQPFLSIPSQAHPIILSCILFVLTVMPTPGIFFWSARRWLTKAHLRIICAPFCSLSFADIFIADQWTSLTFFLADVGFSLCFMDGSGPSQGSPGGFCDGKVSYALVFVSILPNWVRFLQCMRRYRDTRQSNHLKNSGKYISGIVVVVVGAIAAAQSVDYWNTSRICWLFFQMVSTVWKLYWDFVKDWGLFTSKPRQWKFGRCRWIYPCAVGFNFCARFIWIATILLRYTSLSDGIVIVVLGAVEVVRRGVWNLLRVENEHVTNAEQFIAVREMFDIVIHYPAAAEDDVDDKMTEKADGPAISGSPTFDFSQFHAAATLGICDARQMDGSLEEKLVIEASLDDPPTAN